MNKAQFKYKFFWTIWAFGWHRVVSYTGQTIDLKVFIGPVVLTWWW